MEAEGRAGGPVDEQPLRPDGAFMQKVEADTGMSIGGCYGCKKCSNGCPVSFAMDLHPYQVVRLAQFGLVDQLQSSSTIWVCASCQTCLTRCPNEIDLPRLMDYLKQTVAQSATPAAEQKTLTFHRAFLREVAKRGRVFEGGMMARYLLKTGGAFGPEAMANAKLGLAMFKRGRLKLLPHRTRDRRWLAPLFKAKEKSS